MKSVKKNFFNLIVSFFIIFQSTLVFSSPFLQEMEIENVPPAEEAFSFEINKANEDSIILTWLMKENCFLYKQKFSFVSDDKIISPIRTSGNPERINDVYFGEVDVFFNFVSVEIKLDDIIETLNIGYQGCNEKGFCYPLIEKTISSEDLKNL